MWWKLTGRTKNSRATDPDLDQWAEKLENEEQGDQELEMAAELRNLRLATLHTPSDFREALRDNLLDQHVARPSGARKKDRLFGEVLRSRRLWIVTLAVVAAVGLIS